MSPETYQIVESIALDVSLVVLFMLMFFAVNDVMKKNDVPIYGKLVAFGVLGLGALGFAIKGIIKLVYGI
ncbi:MAG: DUF2788 domain-containing protein [Pseudomonadota bacterium]